MEPNFETFMKAMTNQFAQMNTQTQTQFALMTTQSQS